MPEPILESGINFISDNVFHIEKSPLHTNVGKGIKSVEFIRIKDKNLLFVEAKTTFPNPDNPSHENLLRYEEEIMDICDKFIHSLNLYSSVKVGTAEEELPSVFNTQDKIQLVFILVIRNHELKWCRPVKTKLMQTLPSYLKAIWKFNVYVINHDAAIKRQIAVES
jgi:hypothetical protein